MAQPPYPPGSAAYPPGSAAYPPGSIAPQGYAPPPQGYAPPPQGYAPPPQGYAPPPQGYVPPPQGYAPPPQDYGAPPQGYGAPPQGYAPLPQAYGAQPQQPGVLAAGSRDFDATTAVAGLRIAEPTQGTVTDAPGFDAEADATILRKAMKGIGTDEKAIIAVLSKRTAKQRLSIALTFKTMFGKDLVKNLKSELSGNFETLVVSMMQDNAHFDAYCLHKAMKGLGTDEMALTEIICPRRNSEIRDIVAAYRDLYGKDLEKSIVSETSGYFKRLLVSCLQANRAEGEAVDLGKARAEAEELYKAGQARWGTDESKFIHILALRSVPQLHATFEEYRKVSGYDIIRAIEKEMSGNLKSAFRAVVMSVKNPALYFAERLYNAMKGAGTDDETLIRIIVARSEIDMVQIKRAFGDTYHKTLSKMIEGDCSGDYKKLLMAIVGEG